MKERAWRLAEPLIVFFLIMLYIWNLRADWREAWVYILALVLLSHLMRREEASTLGFRLRNLDACCRLCLPFLALFTLTMLAAGMVLQTIRPISLEDMMAVWAFYLPWALFQQYLLNGYFMNRLAEVASPRRASAIAAALFCGVHLPNWVLMVAALAGGYAAARIYHRYRNLYFLGAAHATIGSLLYLVTPDSLIRHLRIGPGWFLP